MRPLTNLSTVSVWVKYTCPRFYVTSDFWFLTEYGSKFFPLDTNGVFAVSMFYIWICIYIYQCLTLFERPFRYVNGSHNTRNSVVRRGKIDGQQSTNLIDNKNRYDGQTYIIIRKVGRMTKCLMSCVSYVWTRCRSEFSRKRLKLKSVLRLRKQSNMYYRYLVTDYYSFTILLFGFLLCIITALDGACILCA